MKAVIVEIRDKYVAAMSEDGRIIRCKNQNYEIGQVIIMEATKNKKLSQKIIARIACAAACIALVSVSAWAYFTPYTYVSLDVNPSVEYKLNRFDMVIEYTAVNEDGQKILTTLELKNKNINQALKETIQKIADDGYFKDTKDAGVVIAISCPDDKKSEELVKTAETEVEKAVEEEGVDAVVEAEGVGLERVKQARELGVTPGKLNLVQKLQASNPDENIDVKQWLTQPVKNIMAQIKENRKEEINSENKKQQDDTSKNSNKENDSKENKENKANDKANTTSTANNSITNTSASGVDNSLTDKEAVKQGEKTEEKIQQKDESKSKVNNSKSKNG